MALSCPSRGTEQGLGASWGTALPLLLEILIYTNIYTLGATPTSLGGIHPKGWLIAIPSSSLAPLHPKSTSLCTQRLQFSPTLRMVARQGGDKGHEVLLVAEGCPGAIPIPLPSRGATALCHPLPGLGLGFEGGPSAGSRPCCEQQRLSRPHESHSPQTFISIPSLPLVIKYHHKLTRPQHAHPLHPPGADPTLGSPIPSRLHPAHPRGTTAPASPLTHGTIPALPCTPGDSLGLRDLVPMVRDP